MNFLATVALAVLAVFAWNESKLATAEARKQAEAAQRQLTLAQQGQRPWISFGKPELAGRPVRGPAQWLITFRLNYKNVGNVPALLVRPKVRAIAASGSSIIKSEQMEACNTENPNDPNGNGFGDVVFPGESFVGQMNVTLDIAGWISQKTNPAVRVLIIAGCISYISANDQTAHTTGLAYSVGLQDALQNRTPPGDDLSNLDKSTVYIDTWRSAGSFWAN